MISRAYAACSRRRTVDQLSIIVCGFMIFLAFFSMLFFRGWSRRGSSRCGTMPEKSSLASVDALVRPPRSMAGVQEAYQWSPEPTQPAADVGLSTRFPLSYVSSWSTVAVDVGLATAPPAGVVWSWSCAALPVTRRQTASKEVMAAFMTPER